MLVDKKFDLGNGGYTTSYNCLKCFKVFEVNFLSISYLGQAYRISTKIGDILYCPFCEEKG